MATSWRIEQAAWEAKPSGDTFSDDALLTPWVDSPEVSEAERRQAALWVAGFFAASHSCNRIKRRRCTRPGHAEAVAEARRWLEAIGLVEEPAEEELAKPAPAPTPAPAPRRKAISRQWQDKAACRDEGPALFYAGEGERQADKELREELAVEICWTCPVRRTCLDYAIQHPEPFGVWGGMPEDERAQERRRRMRRGDLDRPIGAVA